MSTLSGSLFAVTIVSAVAVASVAPANADAFLDLGVSTTQVQAKISGATARARSTDSSLHLGIGVRRELPRGGDIGVRLELDEVSSDALLAVRALDYRFNVSQRFGVGFFLGAARLDLATPAYGYYVGGGLLIKGLAPRWDLGVDLRIGDKVARDNLLPTDPQGGSPDNFYDLTGLSVYLSRRF